MPTDPNDWRPLPGGTMATVHRRGDVVRRSTGGWTPAVHALLRHLEAAGFDRAPRVLGTDGGGRELLSFLPGQVRSARTWRGDDRTLVTAGALLRRYHDTVASFPAGSVSGWDPFFQESTAGEVVCHNDFTVDNCVFAAGLPWAMIDFDGAAPGSRTWDLAATAVSFVPLNPYLPVPDRGRRLRLLCDAYGLVDGSAMVEVIARRLRLVRERLLDLAGGAAPQSAVPRDHVSYYNKVLRLVAEEGGQWESALR